MQDSECQNGAKVIGQATGYLGQIGYLFDVQRNNFGSVRKYSVQDSYGYPISSGYWSYLESWDLVRDESPQTLKSTSHQTLKEGACKQCGNKNDIGTRKCWWCEVPNPV